MRRLLLFTVLLAGCSGADRLQGEWQAQTIQQERWSADGSGTLRMEAPIVGIEGRTQIWADYRIDGADLKVKVTDVEYVGSDPKGAPHSDRLARSIVGRETVARMTWTGDDEFTLKSENGEETVFRRRRSGG